MKPLEIIAALAKRWPKAFILYEPQRRPLKIHITDDIVAAWGEMPWTRAELNTALGIYTGCVGYQARMVLNMPRVDLDGNLCGQVSQDAATHAKGRLVKLRARAARRREAAKQKEVKPPMDLRAHIRARLLRNTTQEVNQSAK
jgi:sRNA-binding protein